MLHGLLASTAGLVVAACSGGGGSGVVAPAPTPTPSPPPPPPTPPPSLDAGYFDPVYGTRYVDSSKAAVLPQIYIDPVAGNDASDGLTRATALKTFGAVWGHAVVGAPGTAGAHRTVPPITIGLVAPAAGLIRDGIEGAVAHAGNGYRTLDRATLIEVTGNIAELSCADVARPADFSPHPTLAGAYRIIWSHRFTRPTQQRFQVLVGGERLVRVREGDLRPGSFAYAGNAWDAPEATITVYPFDGYDPRTGSKDVEITRRSVGFASRGGCVEGVLGQMNADNNGSIVLYHGASEVRASGALWGTKHNMGVDAGVLLDTFVANCVDGDFTPDEPFTANPLVCYGDTLEGKVFRTERCASFSDPSGQRNAVGANSTPFLTHDAAGPGLAHVEMIDWTQSRSTTSYFDTAAMVTITGAYVPDASVSEIFAAGDAAITISKSLLGPARRWVSGTRITVRSSLLVAQPEPFSGGGITTISRNGVIEVRDSILVAPTPQVAPAIDLLNGGVLTLRNNVVSGFDTAFVNAPYSAAPTYPISIDSDYNATVSMRYWAQVRGSGYSLAQFKAAFAGQDGNSTLSADAAALGFQSGAVPTVDKPDVRVNPGSPAAAALANPILQSEIDKMRARPMTIAQWRTYLKTAPSRRTIKTY